MGSALKADGCAATVWSGCSHVINITIVRCLVVLRWCHIAETCYCRGNLCISTTGCLIGNEWEIFDRLVNSACTAFKNVLLLMSSSFRAETGPCIKSTTQISILWKHPFPTMHAVALHFDRLNLVFTDFGLFQKQTLALNSSFFSRAVKYSDGRYRNQTQTHFLPLHRNLISYVWDKTEAFSSLSSQW